MQPSKTHLSLSTTRIITHEYHNAMYSLGVKYHRAGELLMQMRERMALEPKGLVALYYDCMHAETLNYAGICYVLKSLMLGLPSEFTNLASLTSKQKFIQHG